MKTERQSKLSVAALAEWTQCPPNISMTVKYNTPRKPACDGREITFEWEVGSGRRARPARSYHDRLAAGFNNDRDDRRQVDIDYEG